MFLGNLPFSFLRTTVDKPSSCYPTTNTRKLHHTDPPVNDVFREIVAVWSQNRVKVTFYGMNAKDFNCMAGDTKPGPCT